MLKAKLGPGGRLVIPAPYRKVMGVSVGDEVLLRLEEGGLKVLSRASALKRAQRLVCSWVPADVSLTDRLIAERRAEAKRG